MTILTYRSLWQTDSAVCVAADLLDDAIKMARDLSDSASSQLLFSNARSTAPVTTTGSGRYVLAASPGGHLAELHQLVARTSAIRRPLWLTPNTPQSRALLRGEDVVPIPDVQPRDVRGLMRAGLAARAILREQPFARAISTGAGVALAVLPAASRLGVESHYVESAARVRGLSLTGKLMSLVPEVQLWTQYPERARGRWAYAGSVFDQFTVAARADKPARALRVVVTVGTMQDFGFERLVTRLLQVLPPAAQVFWQTGASDVGDQPVHGHRWVSPDLLEQEMREADVVIAHAGVGSALAAMKAGAFPILVPRMARHREHVDDHQLEIAGYLSCLGLAYNCPVDELNTALIKAASRLRLVSHRRAFGLDLSPRLSSRMS